MKEELSKFLGSGFIKENNYHVLDVKEGYCLLEGKVTESSLNPYEIVHGGYIFGLGDTASGIAVSAGGRYAITTNASISFITKATGKKIKAEAKVIKSGKNIANCEVDMFDEEEKLVAKMLLEYYYIS